MKEKKAGKPWLAVLLAIVLFATMLIFSAYRMYSEFEKEMEGGEFTIELPYDSMHEMDGVIYAEI